MNLISEILSSERINVDVAAASRDAVFAHVGALFQQHCGLQAKKVVDALSQREKLGSTGLGMGVAIPHQRVKGLKETQGAFIRLSQPIDFDAPDGYPVNLLFIMLAPEQANESHLRLLAELAQMFSDKAFRETLCTASDAMSVAEAFKNWSIHASSERSPTL
jgi:nitrogen PTS system EIIA component